jgi:hypothetical protein
MVKNLRFDFLKLIGAIVGLEYLFIHFFEKLIGVINKIQVLLTSAPNLAVTFRR